MESESSSVSIARLTVTVAARYTAGAVRPTATAAPETAIPALARPARAGRAPMVFAGPSLRETRPAWARSLGIAAQPPDTVAALRTTVALETAIPVVLDRSRRAEAWCLVDGNDHFRPVHLQTVSSYLHAATYSSRSGNASGCSISSATSRFRAMLERPGEASGFWPSARMAPRRHMDTESIFFRPSRIHRRRVRRIVRPTRTDRSPGSADHQATHHRASRTGSQTMASPLSEKGG
jgi:hypothetical protein